ncbi:MAG: GDP-L-fucose synthase family protein [Hyphomicrobiaceae bacterium]
MAEQHCLGKRYSLQNKRVWVAGHKGMVGSALVRRLNSEDCEIVNSDRSKVDLRQPGDVENWVAACKPDAVFIAAARVGGIAANSTYPVDFLDDNLMIAANTIRSSWRNGVEKLVFLGSSCIYPKHAPQPIKENALLTGPLEPTNEWYAVAKIAGIKLCQAYRSQYGCDFLSAMPTNLYGPGDNFDLNTSHVLPALIRKAHEAKLSGAKELVVWGSGTPRREFLHADDCADALVKIMQDYSADEHINVGSGKDLTILELAETVARIIGFEGKIVLDTSKPDGTPRKLMDGSRLAALGWRPQISLEEGIGRTYRQFIDDVSK